MTIKQWQEMMLTETGETYTVKQAKVMMSIEREHEAEAIAGGKYDVDPVYVPRPRHSESCWIAMERGCECYCGLIPFDESYHGGSMTVAEAQEELDSLASHNHGVGCQETKPVSTCECSIDSFDDCPF